MKPIRHCLNKQLAEICRKSVQLEELTQKINNLLPAHLAPYCKVSSFNKGCLIIVATDATWASQIRYELPELRDQLRKAGIYQLTSIKVNIAEPLEYQKPKKNNTYQITIKAKAKILQESTSCTYEPLRQALLHLAQSGEKNMDDTTQATHS